MQHPRLTLEIIYHLGKLPSIWRANHRYLVNPVLPLKMVDNSASRCELNLGWFSSYSTVQAGHFIL